MRYAEDALVKENDWSSLSQAVAKGKNIEAKRAAHIYFFIINLLFINYLMLTGKIVITIFPKERFLTLKPCSVLPEICSVAGFFIMPIS